MARGLLGLALPPGMVGEDAEVTAIDGDLVSHTLSHQLRSDLVLVLLREGARPVTVICEFQSRADTDMAERMAAYRIETVRTVRRHHPHLLDPGGRVPFTMGVVVHTGSGTWDAATDAAELMAPSDHPGPGMCRLSSAYSVIRGCPERTSRTIPTIRRRRISSCCGGIRSSFSPPRKRWTGFCRWTSTSPCAISLGRQ